MISLVAHQPSHTGGEIRYGYGNQHRTNVPTLQAGAAEPALACPEPIEGPGERRSGLPLGLRDAALLRAVQACTGRLGAAERSLLGRQGACAL